MIERLQDIFNEIYLLTYSSEYSFTNKKVVRALELFVKKIPVGAGDDWLYNFTIFQFAHYSTQKKRFDRVYINWIYGDKALKRWADRTEQQSYYARKFATSIGFRRDFSKIDASEYKNFERARFEDASRQLIHCNELSLFNSKSAICINCSFYLSCKKHEDGRV
jgi:hypothetical protein